jgi:hypothetical protein
MMTTGGHAVYCTTLTRRRGGTAVGVHAADDHPGAVAGALGMLVPPFRSGTSQARHAPAGRRTHPCRAWAHKLVSGHTSPSGRVHLHAALPGQADSSRDDTTVRAVQGQTHPARPAPSSGTVAISTGGSLQLSEAWLRRPGPRASGADTSRIGGWTTSRDAVCRRSRRGPVRPEPTGGIPRTPGRAAVPSAPPGAYGAEFRGNGHRSVMS